MNDDIKQIYATLKFDSEGLQLLIAEYYNTRFNILKLVRRECPGIIDFKITDKNAVIDCLSQAIDEVKDKLNTKLEKVILILPPLNYKKLSLRVSVLPLDGFLRRIDVARAITNSLKTDVGSELMVINTSINKYMINGISTRRFPENERCDEAILDIDLLCGDKALAIDYVNVVYEAGLEVLDLTFNNYAIAKEAVLLEQSINQNIILLDIGTKFTYLTLLSKNKVLSSEVIYEGMDNLYTAVFDKYHLPDGSIPRIVKYATDFESEYLDDAVFAWNNASEAFHITTDDLNNCVKKPLDELIDKILAMCKPIIEKGASFYVCGTGADMPALINCLKAKSPVEVKAYFPDTLGVRDSALCSLYGSLFVYKEKAYLNDLNVNCVDMAAYNDNVEKKVDEEEGESITSKIKKLFEQYKVEEEKK